MTTKSCATCANFARGNMQWGTCLLAKTNNKLLQHISNGTNCPGYNISVATEEQLKVIVAHFLAAAVWATEAPGTHPRVTKESRNVAYNFVTRMVAKCGPLFHEAMQTPGYGNHPDAPSPEAAFGHDLYLTCGKHGVGFLDRAEMPYHLRTKLNKICYSTYIEVHQSRGWIYIDARVYKQ